MQGLTLILALSAPWVVLSEACQGESCHAADHSFQLPSMRDEEGQAMHLLQKKSGMHLHRERDLLTGALHQPPKTCLCVWDIDRTLTAQQQASKECPNAKVLEMQDTAYDGGKLTLSAVGQGFNNTFCAKQHCYIGVVTAGDASGKNSSERHQLVRQLNQTGMLVSGDWDGPSVTMENRQNCSGVSVTSPLVVGCLDGSKHFAVAGIVQWLEKHKNVTIPAANVWMFDDRANNVAPFNGTGFNARQISCKTRDAKKGGQVGLCGATEDEIIDTMFGVTLCSGATGTINKAFYDVA